MFNRQRKLPVDVKSLKHFLSGVADRFERALPFSVVLISDRAITSLNSKFAGKPYPTDVLSFPTSDEDREDEPYMGDIFISVETADRQKSESLDREIRTLALHGLLHLLGYDHESDEGEMSELEGRLRIDFGLATQ